MNETVDGEFQKYSVAGGAYIREHFFGPDPRLPQLVEHLSDDDLTRLRRGGHDYRKLYAAYKAATEYQGRPDGDPGQDDQGLDARRRGRGPKRHPPGEEALRGGAGGLPRPPGAAHPRRGAQGGARTSIPARTRAEVEYLLERRRALGGSLPRRVVRARPLPGPVDATDAEFAPGVHRRGQHDDGVRAAPAKPDAGSRLRAAHRADHPRRGPHVRHGPALQGGRDLRAARASATSRWTRTSSSRTARRRTARCWRRGSRRPGRWPRSRRPRPRYASHAEPMIPFYIFYSMFGFQRTGDQAWAFADARGPRLHDGRDSRADHAERGGPPARGRAQPPPRVRRPAAARLRPGLRLRAGDDRPGRHRADVRRRARTSSTTSRCTTRTTRCRRSRTASMRRSCGACIASCRHPTSRAGQGAGPARRVGHDPPAGGRRARPSRRALRRGRRGVQRNVVAASPARRARGRALEPPPPGRDAARAVRRTGAGSRGRARRPRPRTG